MLALWINLLMAASLPAPATTLPNQPVAQLELPRYLGQWHEMAHLPLFFQRNCVEDITATYSLRPDGRITVHNACRKADGSMQASDGVAKKVGKADDGALKVRFAPAWLQWIPMVWADYWVVELDPGYQWAVVGSPSRKYLWILSRHPTMQRTLFDQLRRHALERGYPVDKLIIAAPLD